MPRAAAKALARGASFAVTTGPCAGLFHDAKLVNITVGRTRTSKFQIKDASISEKHAELYLEGETWFVRDVGSTNGTNVNGRPIDDQGVPLVTGDVIRFGNESLVQVQLQDLAAEQQPAPSNTAAEAVQQAAAAAPSPPADAPAEPAPAEAAAAAAAAEPSGPAVAPLPGPAPSQLTSPGECPGTTLEQYVLQECNRIAANIQAHAEAQVKKLRQDWAATRASWQDMAA